MWPRVVETLARIFLCTARTRVPLTSTTPPPTVPKRHPPTPLGPLLRPRSTSAATGTSMSLLRLHGPALHWTTAIALLSAPRLAHAQRTERVSVDSSGVQGDLRSSDGGDGLSISADGRFVGFWSDADNLVPGDTNGTSDVFVHDRLTGATERVSVDSTGAEADKESRGASISADGRFVAFWSDATNLVAGDVNLRADVFVHDRQTGTTERASVDSAGTYSGGLSYYPAISADGRFVAFVSGDNHLVAGDNNWVDDVFVHDRQTGTTERVSVDSAGTEGNAASGSFLQSISADGRFVAFESLASNLVAGDTNNNPDIFVHDRQTGTTELANVDSSGTQANDRSWSTGISADGRFVAFASLADNLVPGDTNRTLDVFLRDRQAATTELISVRTSGHQVYQASQLGGISADGRYVTFSSLGHFVQHDTNGVTDAFVHDRQAGTTARVSVDSAGSQGDLISAAGPSISSDGRFVAFWSYASNLVASDTNACSDVFVHGPYLTLEADPPLPPAGVTLTFSAWTGAANGLDLLVATDINGTGIFVPITPGSFDASGQWTLSGIVPTGMSGNVITFTLFGIVETGRADLSNPLAVSFQ